MGILTDAFVASEGEVAALGPNDDPAALFPSVRGKRVDTIRLATLEAILAHQPAAAGTAQEYDENFVKDWGEQWVYRFPDPLVSALAQLQPGDDRAIAAAWAATDEWRLDGVTPEDTKHIEGLAELIRGYCLLAQQARREDKHVYMWISL